MAASLPLTALLLLLLTFLVVTINVQTAECLRNSTRVADLLADDEEFSMESEATRRILVGGRPVTPSAKYMYLPYCDRATYGSCIGRDSKLYKRPCQYYNNCVRAAGS